MNPVLVLYALITGNVHRYIAGEIDEITFETRAKMLWQSAAEAHLTMPVLNMLHRADLA